MHRGPIVVIAAMTAVAALGGCGSKADATSVPTVTVTTTVTETATADPSDEAADTTDASSVPPVQTFKIGEKAAMSVGTVSVLTKIKKQRIDDGSDVLNAQAFKVQVCVNSDQEKTPVPKDMWHAMDAASGEYEPYTLSVFDELQPELPDGFDDSDAIAPGTCETGWVGFDLKPSVTLTAAVFRLSDGNQYRWSLT